jgi:hypothetical protein
MSFFFHKIIIFCTVLNLLNFPAILEQKLFTLRLSHECSFYCDYNNALSRFFFSKIFRVIRDFFVAVSFALKCYKNFRAP